MTMDNEALKVLIKLKKEQATKNRQDVLNALMDLTIDRAQRMNNIKNKGGGLLSWFESKEIREERRWVSIKELLNYLDAKRKILIEKALVEINNRYEGGYINNLERDALIEKERKQFTYVRRTIERALDYLRERGLVIHQNHKYSLSNKAILDTTYSSSYLGFTSLSNLMQNLHMPYCSTLKKNLEQLVTFFGCYVVFWLLEASRPTDDNFVNKTRDTPMSKEEKDRLTESWVLDVLQPLLMYKFFLETFLNQIDDRKARRIKRVFKEKRGRRHIYVDDNGKEYLNPLKTLYFGRERYVLENGEEYRPDFTSLKAVPVSITPTRYYNSFPPLGDKQIFYGLDEKMCKKITDTFKKVYPEIYWQLIKGSISNDPKGAKNIHARTMTDIPKVSEYD
jgi:hypothetical protein